MPVLTVLQIIRKKTRRSIVCLLLLIMVGLMRRRHDGTRFVLPWPAARQMSSFDKLGVVHHPEAAKVVFVADKALVQRQVRADRVLVVGEKREKCKLDW